ncbi:uncharacterized protein LOC107308078 [Coturnix japonica]|uniref:uncharacterized protein LOC107308078 n=1 Tax=Coturnix japonica TaxID=93934 RepID=UPI0007778665|nr:uncharacterized protein LOC107308078 [Coturnix japonica]XP_032297957.1 uncharacterized protein LOC107308078 [Coturnix japonica]
MLWLFYFVFIYLFIYFDWVELGEFSERAVSAARKKALGAALAAHSPRPARAPPASSSLPGPAAAWFGFIFNTCLFIYNSRCSDSSHVSAPIYACTPFSFPFPKGQPRYSVKEGESCFAGCVFVCLNIELENTCGLINNKSADFSFPVNDTVDSIGQQEIQVTALKILEDFTSSDAGSCLQIPIYIHTYGAVLGSGGSSLFLLETEEHCETDCSLC